MMNKHDKQYQNRHDELLREIDEIFQEAVDDVARKSLPAKGAILAGGALPPTVTKTIEQAAEGAGRKLTLSITNAITAAWGISNEKNDTLVKGRFGSPRKPWLVHNDDALDAFVSRKTRGLRTSDRVWRYTDRLKDELKMAIQVAIDEGVGADVLSRRIRSYLREPDRLYRKVLDKETGTYRLSAAAMDYHPGRGVYRSSYQNAMRLARTEINKAYRLSDHLRWQAMDFVIGYRIITSQRSLTPVCPLCERLQGVYPKSFMFTGWHPSCRCVAVPVMITDEQLSDLDAGRRINAKQPPIPGNFSDYYTSLKEKIEKMDPDKLPDWILDNSRLLRFI